MALRNSSEVTMTYCGGRGEVEWESESGVGGQGSRYGQGL